MERKILLGTVALVALSASAMAADLPSRRAPPVFVPPLPLFSWAGFYVGGQIGYGFGHDAAVIDGSSVIPPAFQQRFPYGSSLIGIVGGGHVGYNHVLPGMGLGIGSGLVIGIEGDVDGSDYRKTEDAGLALGAPAGLLLNPVHNDIQGSIRGRLGIAVDRALFYVTGGAAFATFKSSYFATIPLGLPGTIPASFTHTRVGYTVGGGVEYAITNNWSLRAEYRYSDFGTFSDPTLFLAGANTIPIRHKETEQRAQVGFSYRFDTPVVPVVARY